MPGPAQFRAPLHESQSGPAAAGRRSYANPRYQSANALNHECCGR
jgi:hypothetical protein